MSKGGSNKTVQKMDPKALAMIKELSDFGKEVAKMPYMPWQGNDVAAMTPQGVAGMQSFADMGNAFGMGMPTNVMAGMPTATTDASGVTGYSAYPAFKEAAAKSATDNPTAAKRYADFFDMSPTALFGAGPSSMATASGSGSGQGNKGSQNNGKPNPMDLTLMSVAGGRSGNKGPTNFRPA